MWLIEGYSLNSPKININQIQVELNFDCYTVSSKLLLVKMQIKRYSNPKRSQMERSGSVLMATIPSTTEETQSHFH